MPGRPCGICSHINRRKIDGMLVHGLISNRALAKKIGVSESSVRRHYDAHISPGLKSAAAETRAEEDHAASLELVGSVDAQVEQIKGRVAALLVKAESNGDLRSALMAAREALRAVELQAKLRHEIAPDGGAVGMLVIHTGTAPDGAWIEQRREASGVRGAVLVLPDNGRELMSDNYIDADA